MKLQDADVLIVGCGIYGVTIARLLTNQGLKCVIIDKRNHVGGNCYSENIYGENNSFYDLHVYGPHVFHTSNKEVIDFIKDYSEFEPFELNILADDGDKLYHLPFNMTTFCEIFGNKTSKEIKEIINKEIEESGLKNKTPENLEEQAISMVGKTIYEKLIKNYTEKQWGKKCTELSPEIIKRLPLRFVFNNNYFNDSFQGIPKYGYTNLIMHLISGINYDSTEKLGEPISVYLNCDYKEVENKDSFRHIFYCGAVDELLNYRLGKLEWRSLEYECISTPYNYEESQGTPIINNVSSEKSYTRTIEHISFKPEWFRKRFKGENIKFIEFPIKWEEGKERFYPVPTTNNIELYNKYVNLLKDVYPNIYLGGRLGCYKYFDMDDAIAKAMEDVKQFNKKYKYLQPYEKFTENDTKIWIISTNSFDFPKNLDKDVYNVFTTNYKYTRDNLNSINKILNEYVGMWYVYKNNIKSDYVGFCHYRRLISLPNNYKKLLTKYDYLHFFDINRYYNDNIKYEFPENKFIEYQVHSFGGPKFLVEDSYNYIKNQNIISYDKFLEINKRDVLTWPNRAIYFTTWENFTKLMQFLEGYINFVKEKHNIVSEEDWINHIKKDVLTYYRSKRFTNNKFPYCSKYSRNHIWDEDEGRYSQCNCWRMYGYMIELMIAVFLLSNNSIKATDLKDHENNSI